MRLFLKFCLTLWTLMVLTAMALPIMESAKSISTISDLSMKSLVTGHRGEKINVVFVTENGNYTWGLVANGNETHCVSSVDNPNMTIICVYNLAKRIVNSPQPMEEIIDALRSGKIIVLNPDNDLEKYFSKSLKDLNDLESS